MSAICPRVAQATTEAGDIRTVRPVGLPCRPLKLRLLDDAQSSRPTSLSYSAFATNYAKEKILRKIFDGFEDLKPKAKIEYLKKLDGLTKQSFYAYFATLNRI